ncbi:hypothetical protein Y032_0545g3244 [Ancylostoma ceylanicum]|nr:hypothetical protein Y032_0545g3244 [Ancylostoma ceylanicum]
MHFLIGIATDEYVILASDKATFAYGAVLADDRPFALSFILVFRGIRWNGEEVHRPRRFSISMNNVALSLYSLPFPFYQASS